MNEMIGTCFLVCSNQRTGSTLLCELLSRTGKLGRPYEFFERGHVMPKFLKKIHIDSCEEAWRDLDRYLDALRRCYSSQNGVFGIKAHYDDFCYARSRGFTPERSLPNAKHIYCSRRDIVAQAISAVKANQTRCWVSFQKPEGEACYDPEAITRTVAGLWDSSSGWERYFVDNGIEPMRIVFEDLVAQKNEHVRRVARFLGVRVGWVRAMTVRSRLKPQSDQVNREWRQRYRAHLLGHGVGLESREAVIDFARHAVNGSASAAEAT